MSAMAEAVQTEAPERESPFSVVMKIWASWMTLTDRQHSAGYSNPQDVKEFMSCGEAVDTMINDLPRVQWWAIRKAYGIATVWRFPDHSFADALSSAEATLLPKLKKNLATRRYFIAAA